MNDAWSHEVAIERLRPVLWRYLSASAQVLRHRSAPTDEFELEPDDLQRLAMCHLAVSEETLEAVRSAAVLLRSMPASVARERRELFGVVNGRVNWQRTIQGRLARSDRTLFVCEQADRRYDTSLGRLLKLALRAVSELHAQARLTSPMPGRAHQEDLDVATQLRLGDRVALTSAVGRTLSQNPKLRQVRVVERSTLRDLDALEGRYPAARPIVAFVNMYYRLVTAASEGALRTFLESQVFAPGESDRLFELETGTQLVETLRSDGFDFAEPVSLLPRAGVPFAELTRAGNRCRIWWQRSPWKVVDLPSSRGLWRQALDANQIPNPRSLMPDFVVEGPRSDMLLLVEVKHSDVGEQRERDGLRDMLSYLFDLSPLVSERPPPKGLVVSWNATGVPTHPELEIQSASQTTLPTVFRDLCHTPPGRRRDSGMSILDVGPARSGGLSRLFLEHSE